MGVKIKRSIMKSGRVRSQLFKRTLAVLLASGLGSALVSGIVMAAEMQALPPVTVPPVGAVLPETLPPIGNTSLPPVVTLGSSPPGSLPPVALPTVPASPEPLPVNPAPIVGVLPPSSPMTFPTRDMPLNPVVPEVSQSLNAVAPTTLAQTEKMVEEEGVYFNVADEDIREVVKQISRALGKDFLLDDKLKGKVTIISERKMTKDEIWEAFQSALDVLGFTIVQGPAGLLKIIGTKDALSNPIDLYTDQTPFSDRFLTRLITLKNISATDMANVIKGLVSKEGNLFAYPVTNTLILTDSGTNIDRLMRLITELDREGPQEVIEIIPILYADVKDLSGKITQIFETEKASGGGSSIAKKKDSGADQPEEIPTLRKVIPDERTNSLIVLASKMAIQRVREMIRKLDSPVEGSGEVHVYYLKYSNAKDMAAVLSAISGAVASEKKSSAPGAPADTAKSSVVSSLVGGAQFSGKFSVTADEGTNALVITANGKDFDTLLEQVISKLDIPRQQVYVEAVIVEFSSTMNEQLGSGLLGGKQLSVGGNEIALFGSTFGYLDSGATGLLNGTVGGANTGSTITLNQPGGTTLEVPAFFAALQYTHRDENVNVLSTPNILTLDNQEAEIKVGGKIYQVGQTTTNAASGTVQSFVATDVGLSLKVKPQVSEGGSIRMEVFQDDSEVLPTPAGAANAPTTNRSIKTVIIAKNGQTIVLGGLMKDKYTTVINKIPGLGDIPILGYLFKSKTKEKRKVNLTVFLTPHIIREPRDFLVILQKKINEQNAFLEQNYGKKDQAMIRKSLEKHASGLLNASSAADSYSEQASSDEGRFPMNLESSSPQAPSPSAPKVSPQKESAPPTPPAKKTDDGADLSY